MGDTEAMREAIATVEDSRQTHVEWIEYLAKYGNDLRPHEEIAGDTAHHREAVEKYDQVLSVLRAALASTEAPESPKRKVSYTSSDACPGRDGAMSPVNERQIIVAPSRRVIRYHHDQVGNDLSAVLRWCSTHDEPVWVYGDGSHTCPHEMIVGWSPDPHDLTDAPWEDEP